MKIKFFCFGISDISSIFKDPPPGMFIAPDPDNITKVRIELYQKKNELIDLDSCTCCWTV